MRKLAFPALLLFAASTLVIAQSATVDNATRSDLLAQGRDLKQSAVHGSGTAAIKLKDYPNHYTMLSYRNTTGGSEIHEHYADFFIVLQGSATLMTGGKLTNDTTASPGEHRGTAIEGGTPTPLHEGDCVHIPAGTPHQLLIPTGSDFLYYVIKAKEN